VLHFFWATTDGIALKLFGRDGSLWWTPMASMPPLYRSVGAAQREVDLRPISSSSFAQVFFLEVSKIPRLATLSPSSSSFDSTVIKIRDLYTTLCMYFSGWRIHSLPTQSR
jgi:hypothetical protein